eukprot:TRINITY_DN18525_c0_g1::TRINITY_DN18525_c0_g1_i1::g.2772::m.2772 TRINITY_DN18525_c0_g1::TRINITY_DN18525_c0_g1_i1::g.2772  ORF type:complete len:735 (+),score=253.18,sp/Q96VB9/HSP7F_CANAL/30.96/7e-43,HSP70/PF00012.15/4.7e-61,HSP70/PF00012.15/0.0016,HSP70/PF00012.15/1.4e+03,TPR_11/PF13414.1/3.1e-08,TPR_11/PF13414.1/0.038,TPR_1/PF00515.23/3.7e+03,TPR_1/PF00515.23/1.6e+03,TPR_1/PF00515.23/2.6e-05,TPR_1/PF00515.23/6.2e+02,TPR_9/PF13371.1/1.9e+03,TPR_9/PF13371.1/1.3e+03,TPR_9/PF13371.1/0.00022,TPR_2/PF
MGKNFCFSKRKMPSCFGIDLGTATCIVAATSTPNDPASVDLVLNELSNRATPNQVAFLQKRRYIGETAIGQELTNGENTIGELTRFVGRSYNEFVEKKQAGFSVNEYSHHRFCAAEGLHGEVAADVSYDLNGEENHTFTARQLLSMLLLRLRQDTAKYLGLSLEETTQCVIAIPGSYSEAQIAAVKDAARLAGLDVLAFISTSAALAATYENKHITSKRSAGKKVDHTRVCIVDVGHAFASASVLDFKENGGWDFLASQWDDSIGGAVLDRRLFEHIHTTVLNKTEKAQPGKRLSVRVMREVRRAKHVLSGNPHTTFLLEGFDDRDVHLELTREKFTSLCHEEEVKLGKLVESALASLGDDRSQITSVEVVGHGAIPPFLQNKIGEVSGLPLGRTLDSGSAVALGAAWIAARLQTGVLALDTLNTGLPVSTHSGQFSDAELENALKLEKLMAEQDTLLNKTGEKRDALESYLNRLNEACDMHAALRGNPEGAALKAKVEDARQWLDDACMDGDAGDINFGQYQAKIEELQKFVTDNCVSYTRQLEEARAASERKSQEDAERYARERAAVETEDHDNRKLKKEDRMRMVEKNKAEANELFQAGSFELAAARYLKSLTHCEKFFDLSAQDKQEVEALRVALYLNLAMCYLKLEKWQKVIANCDSALQLDKTSTKALYRRALARDNLNDSFGAWADLKVALESSPNDPALKALATKVQADVKRLQDQEKATYAKMFA